MLKNFNKVALEKQGDLCYKTKGLLVWLSR